MSIIRGFKAWLSSIKHYLQSTRRELDRIKWPNRQTTFRLTYVVIGTSVVIGALLFIIDYTLLKGLTALFQ